MIHRAGFANTHGANCGPRQDGGGIAAAQDAFVLTRLGHDAVAVYDHSLQEWTQNPDNPMAVSPAAE